MPRVHTQKARKAIYAVGGKVKDSKTKSGFRRDRSIPANDRDRIIVEAGQTYYWWKFRYGGKVISTTYPKPSQLTQSEFLQKVYGFNERIQEAEALENLEELESLRDEIIQEAEELRDEQEEKRNNMPEHLQDVGSGEILQNRYDSLDEFINSLELLDFDEDNDFDEALEEFLNVSYEEY